MIIEEIFFGVLALIIGAFVIYLAFTKKITQNLFQKFLGRTETRLAAYRLLGGSLFCLLGLFMILQGLGIFR